MLHKALVQVIAYTIMSYESGEFHLEPEDALDLQLRSAVQDYLFEQGIELENGIVEHVNDDGTTVLTLEHGVLSEVKLYLFGLSTSHKVTFPKVVHFRYQQFGEKTKHRQPNVTERFVDNNGVVAEASSQLEDNPLLVQDIIEGLATGATASVERSLLPHEKRQMLYEKIGRAYTHLYVLAVDLEADPGSTLQRSSKYRQAYGVAALAHARMLPLVPSQVSSTLKRLFSGGELAKRISQSR